MKNSAIIRVKGSEYYVTEGDEILVAFLGGEKPEVETLLSKIGGKVSVGKPVLSGTTVKIKVLAEEEKGEKISVFKYKAKARYRRKAGFRPKYTRLQIEKIV